MKPFKCCLTKIIYKIKFERIRHLAKEDLRGFSSKEATYLHGIPTPAGIQNYAVFQHRPEFTRPQNLSPTKGSGSRLWPNPGSNPGPSSCPLSPCTTQPPWGRTAGFSSQAIHSIFGVPQWPKMFTLFLVCFVPAAAVGGISPTFESKLARSRAHATMPSRGPRRGSGSREVDKSKFDSPVWERGR